MTDLRCALQQEIDREIACFSGRLGLYAKCLETGEIVARHENVVMPTASCIKLFVLLSLMRAVAAGRLRLDQPLAMSATQQVGGSGVLKDLAVGVTLPLRDVATLMIVLSDNSATNMLIDLLGLDTIAADIAALGLRETRLLNRVSFETIGSDVRRFGLSTAAESAAALEVIAAGRFVDSTTSDQVIDIMARQQYLDLLPRYLPYNPYARELGETNGLRIANKTGFFTGVRCDTAILFMRDRTVVIAALTDSCRDPSFASENEAATFLGRIGALLHRHWSPPAS